MTPAVFEALVAARIEKVKDVLLVKAKEYSSNVDRLHNFKRGAELTGGPPRGRTPSQVCFGYLLKHLTSLSDLADDMAREDYGRMHLLDEKVGDCLNYILLLEACLIEEWHSRA